MMENYLEPSFACITQQKTKEIIQGQMCLGPLRTRQIPLSVTVCVCLWLSVTVTPVSKHVRLIQF